MHTVPLPLEEQALRGFIRAWVGLLAAEDFEGALAELYRGDINPFGLNPSYAGVRWTPDLLRQVIHNYGLFDDEQTEAHVIATHALPVSDANEAAFEQAWWYDAFDDSAAPTYGLDRRRYAGMLHFHLPLAYHADPTRISDLCARMHIRRISDVAAAIELDTVHVL